MDEQIKGENIMKLVIQYENGKTKEIKVKEAVKPNCEDCDLFMNGAPCPHDYTYCEDFVPYDKSGCVFIDGKWWSE